MKAERIVLLLSISAVLLLGSLAWAKRPGQTTAPATPDIASSTTAVPGLTEPIPATESAKAPEPPRPAFRWSQVESSDYQQYIANLRAIGCPERVIQDIISADVAKLYEAKEGPLKAQLAALPKKQTNAPAADQGNTQAEFALRKQLREIEKEKQAVTKELVGVETPLAPLRGRYPRDYARYEAALNTLPSAQRELVRQIQENYWEASDQLNDKYESRRTPEFLEEYKRINSERQTQMAQALTPQELADYEMRSSSLGERLTGQLSGAGTTADEFREIYRLKNEVETPFGGSVRVEKTEQGVTPELQQRRQETEQKIAQLLGPERYAAYQQAQDSNFRRLADLGDRYGIEREKVVQAYELQKEIKAEEAQLRAARKQTAAPPPGNAELAERQAQHQQAMKNLLGETAFNALQRGQNFQTLEQILLP